MSPLRNSQDRESLGVDRICEMCKAVKSMPICPKCGSVPLGFKATVKS